MCEGITPCYVHTEYGISTEANGSLAFESARRLMWQEYI